MKRRKNPLWGLLLAAAALASGCVNDNDPCPAPEEAPDGYTLRLDIVVPNAAASRAAGHGEEDGDAAENTINLDGNDFRVLLFGRDGSMLTEMSNLTSRAGERAGSLVYTLEGELDSSVDPAGKLETFRIMVLANWESFEGSGAYGRPFNSASVDDGSLKNIYRNGVDFNFDYPAKTLAGEGLETWRPETGTYIPMFGVSGELSINTLTTDTDDAKSKVMADIQMVRAVAKVELIDNTTTGISDLTLSRAAATGRYIPDLTDENNENWLTPADAASDLLRQLAAPSLPASASDLTMPLAFFKTERDGVEIDGEQVDNVPVWIAYIPEMDLSAASNKPRPTFDFKVGSSSYSVAFNNYSNGTVNTRDELQSVLRNHIYRYQINGSSFSAYVEFAKVLDWDVQSGDDDELFYDDVVVAPDGYMKWKTTYGEGVEGHEPDEANGYTDDRTYFRLLMVPGVDTYAEATFTLLKPMKARWQASLTKIQGEENAFRFVTGALDAEGSLIEGGDSGTIEGDEIKIRIANREERVYEVNNEAKLVIRVQLPDKSWIEADVCLNDEGKPVNYTIVQNKTVL